ncbi:probable cytochrome P450 49a1 isoform X2 [Palaemon carinicauda]|uniref:probable cytochrome P450 49a1 isoform X2 n=1 Tax=Palaemon carinicauda TaxID=392227 RepID=UPI0035B63CCA
MIRKRLSSAANVAASSRAALVIFRGFGTSSATKQQVTGAVSSLDDKTPLPSSSAVKPTSEIPGPKRYPFVGSLLSVVFNKDFDKKRIHKTFHKMVEEYGPIVRFESPTYRPSVFLSDPRDCETVVRATMENPIREGFFSLHKVRRDSANKYFEGNCGLLVENDEKWKRLRSRFQTPMLKPKNVSHYMEAMDEVTLEFMERIASLQKQHGEMPPDFQFELYKWASESVGLVALNRRLGCLDPNISSDSEPMKLIQHINTIFDSLNECEHGVQLWRLYPTASYKKLQKAHEEFLRIADQNIRQTEEALLSKTRTDEDENLTLMEELLLTPGLSRKDVVTLILDMLFAGVDTTSHTIGFTLYLLAKNPNCQAKLQDEVDNVIGNHEGPLTPKHIAQMSYLKAVVKESFRVFPLTMGTVRTLEKDLVLSGYHVPKGWAAVLYGMGMGHDERNFPRAKEFIPERWLRHKPLGPIHPFSTFPFGLGTRMCIGRRIAEQELYTFLTRVVDWPGHPLPVEILPLERYGVL